MPVNPNLRATLEGDDLVIRIPVNNPLKPSATGKTWVLASSYGNITTSLLIEDKPVVVGLNAYIKK